jgi:transcription elongation factor Elf1
MRESMNETMARLVGKTDGPPAAHSCAVCGSARVVTDEVEDEVKLYLAECLHCSHRWIRVTEPSVSRALQPAATSSKVARRPTGLATAA